MDTIVNAHAAIPEWDQLTTAQRFAYAGNLDPWAGPVDPKAHARWAKLHRAGVSTWQAEKEQAPVSCGCWQADCAECGAKRSQGKRPVHGVVRRFGLGRRG